MQSVENETVNQNIIFPRVLAPEQVMLKVKRYAELIGITTIRNTG